MFLRLEFCKFAASNKDKDEIDETIFCDNSFEHGVDGYAFGTGTLHFEHPNATLGAD